MRIVLIHVVSRGRQVVKKQKKREGLGKPSLHYSDFRNEGKSFLVLVITISIFKEFTHCSIHSGESVLRLTI